MLLKWTHGFSNGELSLYQIIFFLLLKSRLGVSNGDLSLDKKNTKVSTAFFHDETHSCLYFRYKPESPLKNSSLHFSNILLLVPAGTTREQDWHGGERENGRPLPEKKYIYSTYI